MPTKKQLESQFDTKLTKELRERLPDCFIYKMDPNQVQGIPDRLILWRDRWATLETKRGNKGRDAARQPNQEYYVDKFNEMSFSAFINPENCEEVLDALQEAFGA